jgi:hypothetical protein
LIQTPVVFLIFNRPDETARSFAAIRAAPAFEHAAARHGFNCPIEIIAGNRPFDLWCSGNSVSKRAGALYQHKPVG